MAEIQTIARPYARAVFSYASDDIQRERWLKFLQASAQILGTPDVQQRLGSPNFVNELSEWLNQWLMQTLNESISTQEQNFLHLLVDNDRLFALPQIAEIYEELLLAHNNTYLVKVQSAKELTAEEISNLRTLLSKKVGGEVELRTEINPDLLAGVVIEYDGQVIDQSMKGRIAAFARTLD